MADSSLPRRLCDGDAVRASLVVERITAFVYWHVDHYHVEFEGREVARSEAERENAVDFANGFNLGMVWRRG